MKRYPLTSEQMRLWLEWKLNAESRAYNTAFQFEISGELQLERFKQAVKKVRETFYIGRLRFVEKGDQVWQEVLSSKEAIETYGELPDFRYLDLTTDSTIKEPRKHALNLHQEFVRYRFDLNSYPLEYFTLIKFNINNYLFSITAHHIITDGYTGSIILKLLSEFYNRRRTTSFGLKFRKKKKIGDYLDYVRQNYTDTIKTADQIYWKKSLYGAEFHTDFKQLVSGERYDLSGHRIRFAIDQEAVYQIEAIAKNEETTVFLVLITAFKVMLYRYTGQEDITISYPVNLRPREKGFDLLAGFMVNVLLLRSNLSENPSFRKLLSRISSQRLDDRQHQRYPFLELIQIIRESNPNFQAQQINVSIAQTAFGTHDLKFTGFNLIPITEIDYGEVQADLTLLYDYDKSIHTLEFGFEYRASVFNEGFIKQMQIHFVNLISDAINNPDKLLSKLNLLTKKELHQQLVVWNDTVLNLLTKEELHQQLVVWNDIAKPCPMNKTIHELFEEQVEKIPNAIAVVCHDAISVHGIKLNYRDLNSKANQLAYYLIKLGVQSETLVAICLERSLEMIIGILGILKAGGACVPIDPNYPEVRIQYILKDTQTFIMLTKANFKSSLMANFPNIQIIALDTDWPSIQIESTINPMTQIQSNHLSYVFYTSGSTGQPKGVMIEHKSIANWLIGFKYLKVRLLFYRSFAFDASICDYFLPLSTGAFFVILSDHNKESLISSINTLVKKYSIKQISLTPSLMPLFLDYCERNKHLHQTKTLERIITSGEVLSPNLVKWFFQLFVGIKLYNCYGPTEGTIDTSFFECTPDTVTNYNTVPIGKPSANTKVYVLDQFLNLVPIGAPGELCIGGIGVTRGYLNQPELTQKKFIKNPFSDDPNDHLYKSGDLVRWLPDGNLEFLGRVDYQVKVRGFRIETEEIENCLTRYETVKEAVVLAREDISGQKQLVAYIVCKDGVTEGEEAKVRITELRESLTKTLPHYMVPSFFILLESFSLTPNGKIDRRALPAPEIGLLEEEFESPQTETERQLATFWSELLQFPVKKIGRKSNFFHLGGDSIKIVQLIARLNELGLHVTPKQIFTSSTIAEIANVIQKTRRPHIEQGLTEGTALLTPVQHWFFERDFEVKNHFNQAVLLRLANSLSIENIKAIFAQLVQHHDVFRLYYTQEENVWYQNYAEVIESVMIKEIDISLISESDYERFLQAKCTKLQSSLNIHQGHLICIGLFNGYIDKSQRLLIAIHHLIVDGVSWRILIEDFERLYVQQKRGEEFNLPPKTSSYKAWGETLMNYAVNKRAQEQWNYWLEVGSGASVLPIDHEFEDEIIVTGKNKFQYTVELSRENTEFLIHKVPAAYNTQINDILLTALILAAKNWTGQNDLFFHLEGHGREECIEGIDVSRTIGWFTSIFPVHLKIPEGEKAIAGIIKSIQEQLKMIPDKGIGYGVLKYLCRDDERSKQLKLRDTAQIVFNYLGNFDEVDRTRGILKITMGEPGLSISKKNKLSYLISVNGMIINGCFQIKFTYSAKHFDTSTIEYFAISFQEILRNLISHCLKIDTRFLLHSENSNQDSILIPIKTEGSKTPVYLIHNAAGISSPLYQHLSAFLEGHPIFAIDNPRFGKIDAYESISEMTKFYLSEILKVQPVGPYILGGHCWGGEIAIEIARQLKILEKKESLVLLINSLHSKLIMNSPEIKALSLSERRSLLNNELKRMKIDPALDSGSLFMIELENCIKLRLNSFQTEYRGRVVLLKAQSYEYETMRKTIEVVFNGWRGTLPQLEIYSVPGAHYTLFEEENVAHLGRTINQILSTIPDPVLSNLSIPIEDRQLLLAAKNQDMFIFERIIAMNVNIEIRDSLGQTAIYWAVFHGNMEMVGCFYRYIVDHKDYKRYSKVCAKEIYNLFKNLNYNKQKKLIEGLQQNFNVEHPGMETICGNILKTLEKLDPKRYAPGLNQFSVFNHQSATPTLTEERELHESNNAITGSPDI